MGCGGSPPRGRGKVTQHFSVPHLKGITPAWAGKSNPKCVILRTTGDHPRVGGEKLSRLKWAALSQGSPPRGRGKAKRMIVFSELARITPAWAGKSCSPGTSPAHHGDHPRVGGEKFSCSSVMPGILGSPPRGRGKGHQCGTGLCPARITPAWAGKRVCVRFSM